MRQLKSLALHSSALVALSVAFALPAQAQVQIDDDTDTQIRTSEAGPDGGPSDVTIGTETDNPNDDPTVTVGADGTGVVLDSANALELNGTVSSNNVDGATGVELQGGDGERSYRQTGAIELAEDYSPSNTDDDPLTDEPFAQNEGLTGILISGASPFQGNVELESSSTLLVEGNESYGIHLENTPMMDGLTGNLRTSGAITVRGDDSFGVAVAGNVTGDVTNEGTVSVTGIGSEGYSVTGDIDGSFVNSGNIGVTGYRFARDISFGGPDVYGREDLNADDLGQAGPALRIAGDVSGGVLLGRTLSAATDANGDPLLDTDGNQLFTEASRSEITQIGSAPAVIIGGDGDPIAIGLVAAITDPDDPDFDGDLQYGFINQGNVTATGLFDDFDATAISITNATLEGGFSNSATGILRAQALRSAVDRDTSDGDGVARVLVFGDQAIADVINNQGIIEATVAEAADEVFFDRENIIAPRNLLAIAVEIEGEASVGELINDGSISAVLTGRDGQAVAIRDASGTLRTLTNRGNISARGSTSDTQDQSDTEFDLIAIDLRAATEGITLLQETRDDALFTPGIVGDIYLGSGDDTVSITAGAVVGDLDFGGGDDALLLSGGAVFGGEVTNADTLQVEITDGAILALGSDDSIEVSSAVVDGTAIFRPFVNGETGEASALTGGPITFEAGAGINPFLSAIVGTQFSQFTLANSDNLTIADIAGLSAGDRPFLYNTQIGFAENGGVVDTNTLVLTLDLRDPGTSVEAGGLGLDQAQQGAFEPFLQSATINTALGDAFANIVGAEEFYSAYNQLLPEFSGAGRQFVLANVDGAVGAVGSQLDTARRSQEKPGGAWLQEFFYFADRDLAGQSEQFRGNGFGFAGGIDTELGPFHAVGVTASFASTEVEDVLGIDDPLDVRSYQAGAYAGFENSGFNLDLYGGAGISQFQQNRRIQVGNFAGGAEGEWDGFHANASARLGYMVPLSEKYWIRPSASLDYLYLNEYGHTETGTDGFRLRVDGRRSETASATAMLDFGANFQGKRTWIRPSIRAGYRNDFISDPLLTQFRFQGLSGVDGAFDSELAELRAIAFPDDALILGFTVAAGSQFSSIGFDFDSDIRDGFVRHTGRIVIRLLF